MAYKPTYEELEQRVHDLEQAGIEHRQVENELRISEKLLRNVMDIAPSFICAKDLDGRFILANKKLADFYGTTVEEMTGMLHADICENGEELQGMLAADCKVIYSEKPKYIPEETMMHSDGSISVLETHKIPFSAYDDPAVLIVSADITDRKQAEEALRASEERYRNLVENSLNAIILYRQQEILFANEPFFNVFGYEHNELRGISVDNIMASEVRNAVAECRKRRILGEIEKTAVYESKGRRKDGEIFDMEISVCVISHQGEQCCMAFLSDISKRKQAEEALGESEEKYRTILETIEDGYFEVDLGGNFTFFNDSLCEILGYSKDELMGMNNRQYTDENIAKKLYQTFNKVYTTGKPEKSFHWPVIRKDSTKRTVAASVSLRRDTEGEPVGFRGIVRDISERKHLEARLQQVHKMELVGTLAGGIAHDYNNLLAVIIGNLSMAQEETDPHSITAELLHEVEQASLKAKDLSHQFLALSDGGHPVKMLDSVESLLKEIPEQVQAHDGIEYALSIQNDLWSVEYDPRQIEHTITSLLMNAVEAIPRAGALPFGRKTRSSKLETPRYLSTKESM